MAPRGNLDRVCRVDDEPGDQMALRQDAADALDEAGCPSSVAGANLGVELRPADAVRALVPRDAQYWHFSSTSGVVALTLKWSLRSPASARMLKYRHLKCIGV